MNQVSPSRAARSTAASALAPSQIGGCGLLHRLERDRRVVEREMRACHGHAVLGPEADDGLEVLFEPRHPLRLRRAETLELHLAIAEPGAEDHAPARHHVEGGDLLGDIQRLVQREQDDPRQQPATRRLGHEAREQRHLLVLLQRVGGVVHTRGEDVEPQLVREPRLGAEVREPRVHVLAAAELAADEESVLHGAPQPAAGTCAMVRRQSSSSGSTADQSRVQ